MPSLAVDVLHTLAESLVLQQKYKTTDDALRYLAGQAVRDKLTYYRARMRKMERKYNCTFEAFTQKLKGSASIPEEDDWLDWKSARSMLADWENTYRELGYGSR